MHIEILDFIPNEQGSKKGYVDFKISYDEKRWEIFRNLCFYEKGDKKWINFGACKRGEVWVPRYERFPKFRYFPEVIQALEDYFGRISGL